MLNKTVLFFYFTILFLIFSGCNTDKKANPYAIKGMQNLTDWDFEKNGIVQLDGDWEFYWHKLYSPGDFKNDSLIKTPVYIKVPGLWNNVLIDSNEISGQGFATYRLRVKLNKPNNVLGIKLLDASSAYKLWINDSLIYSNGNVSSNPLAMKAQMLPGINNFNAVTDQAEIIIQVSNNFHHKGGLWESISVGTPDQISHMRINKISMSVFLSGILFILFIYHFWIYFLRRSEKAAFWFGLLCFSVLIRTLLINERIIYIFFPEFSINIGYRIEYLITFTLSLIFALYNYYLFEKINSKLALKIIGVITLLESLIILFTPAPFYTSLVIVFQAIMYFQYLYFFIITYKQARKKKRIAILLIFSWIVVLCCAFNDILYLNLVINTMVLSHFAFFIFLLTQAYVLSFKISQAFKTIENLSSELSVANVTLEQKVEDRTRDLRETQAQLIHQEKLASLVHMTAGIAHEIKNPLNFVNNFSAISKDLLKELTEAKTAEERNEVTELLEKNLEKIEQHGRKADKIVNNMLEHSRTTDNQRRSTDINQFCEEYFLFGYHAMRAGNIGFKCVMNTEFAADIPQLNIVQHEISRALLNILNNAFYELQKKSAGKNGFIPEIILKTEFVNNKIEISIRDNGNGIPESITGKIFEPFFTTKPTGQGTGLGLSMSYDIIKSHGGTIRVESEMNIGSNFIIELPV